MSAATLARLADAFDDDEPIDPTYCVGNSHLLIEHYYSAVSARCACGSTVIQLTNGSWTHRSPGANGIACPPYNCECGQRHNVRVTDTMNPVERALQLWIEFLQPGADAVRTVEILNEITGLAIEMDDRQKAEFNQRAAESTDCRA